MSQKSQAETREIVAELKAIIMETLQILDDKECPSQNVNRRKRAKKQRGS